MSGIKNNTNQPTYDTFFTIPRYIFDLPNITLGYIKVYETIFQFWSKGYPCFLSNQSIMERARLGITQVKDALLYFEKAGELKREIIGTKRYLIQPERRIETDLYHEEMQAAPPAGGSRSTGQQVAAPPATEYKEKYNNLNKDLKDIVDLKKSTIKMAKTYKDDERFMKFYSVYPRKEKPRDAWKAFKSIIGGDDILLETVLEDIKARISSQTSWNEKQFIPLPASYLRSGYFEGEILDVSKEEEDKRLKLQEVNKLKQEAQEKASKERANYEMGKERGYIQDRIIYSAIQQEVSKGNNSKPSEEFTKMLNHLRNKR